MEFATLARTFEQLEQTSSRLKLVELLTNLFRSIERPEEIQQICYLCNDQANRNKYMGLLF